MNIDVLSPSSDSSSDSRTSSSSGESLDEFHRNILQGAKFWATSLKLDEILTASVLNYLTMKTTKSRWVLQAAWLDYKEQYGSTAYEGPEHKISRHVAYRQLVRWCWGVFEKEIRVVLPSCAVSCIQAHFPPPSDEDDFEFVGFRFADE
ncbi:Hypothetical predicted protein [Paramuricea clavata]|uniref:Uncharacterized protein n=1 Tax=Paramuricea clavata TaxID=317549 RepID=A0A7D9HM10_PARCT|nr:Hypothetical predicted protein [Paramuricea clavata]